MTNQELEDLHIRLGEALVAQDGELGIRPPSRRELTERAQRWLVTQRDQILRAIKDDPQLASMAFNPHQRNKQLLIATIGDAIVVQYVGLPALVIATLFVHCELDKHRPTDSDDDPTATPKGS